MSLFFSQSCFVISTIQIIADVVVLINYLDVEVVEVFKLTAGAGNG